MGNSTSAILSVGLLDSQGVELSTPGYSRQQATFRRRKRLLRPDVVENVALIIFRFNEKARDVAFVAIVDDNGPIAHLRFDRYPVVDIEYGDRLEITAGRFRMDASRYLFDSLPAFKPIDAGVDHR